MKPSNETGEAPRRSVERCVRPDVKPPVGGLGGCIHDWERSLDPWHEEAFPDDLKHAAPRGGKRLTGWMALDAWGNPLMFLADGEPIPA